VFTSIDAALGNRLPLTRRLLQLLKLAPGKEFDNVGDVLSLYDKQQLGKLAEDGKMAEAVPEGGFCNLIVQHCIDRWQPARLCCCSCRQKLACSRLP
jgi:hypothetical protein